VASHDTLRRRKDGSLLHASVNIFPIEVRNQELVGASKISREVTALKKLEAQVIEAQKMEVVGQLAAGMAHDFNNLLVVILSCGELLLEDLGAGSAMRVKVETILQAAQSAAGLTRQLLVLSRKQNAKPVVLELDDLVVRLDNMLRQLLAENIELSVVRGARAGRIKADAGQIGQLLLNLVANARDAMPDGGKLSIATSHVSLDADHARAHAGVSPGEHVLLTVSDTGTGLSEEARAHLFEPFFTTKPKGKGTGLGLATCDMIVKECGGHIDVRSEAGRGTVFQLSFPAVDAP
jgi:signal transduction histidine kinase